MRIFFFIIVFIIISLSLYSTIINVSEGQSIQTGIDAAANTDTVLVLPGTYIENINYNGKFITVASLFLTTADTSYISSTIIDGNSSGSVVTFENGENATAVLCGFTLTNGLVDFGGGIYCLDFSSPSLDNLIIISNTANLYGGGIDCYNNSNPNLNNVLIADNSANYGGGIDCYESNLNLNNVTITDNFSSANGGGIYCYNSSQSIINSILWNNSPQEIYLEAGGSVSATYSDIEGGWTGTGNIDSDPLFINPTSENYHLQFTSPCIDSGDPSTPLNPDSTRADMGAYYFHQHSGPIWHISTIGSDITGNGSEQFPFASIQYGINASSTYDTVLVQPGTYVENIDLSGRHITVGSLFLTTQDTTYISQTVIDGNGSGSVVIIENVDYITGLSGFTITNGFADDYAESGGGIYCWESSPSLDNLVISGNSANLYGGGIYCGDNTGNLGPNLDNVIISDNNAAFGGGICCNYSSPNMQNVTVSDNDAGIGGGVYCLGSDPILMNVTISGNSIGIENGGGIYCSFSNPILKNVTISNNYAGGFGGGIYYDNSSPNMQNVTISDNLSPASGIYCNNSDLVIANAILWGNMGSQISVHSGSTIITYSNIEGGWTGTGNINNDPLFVNSGIGDYYLQLTSPCIDTGDPVSPLDPDGTRADMGAYFYDQSFKGTPSIIDITDIPNDQGRSVIVTWEQSFWDYANSDVPIVNYGLWEKYPFELDRACLITNDINEAIEKEDTYFQREDTTWVFIVNVPAMQWTEYSALAETFLDSTTVGDYLSYFFVSAHTENPSLHFRSSTASGYSVDNIAPDETEVYITQNSSSINLSWDEVEYGTYQGNSYPEINGIWYKIYAGDSPDFVCDELHLIDTVTNVNYEYPISGEDKKFFKMVVSDQP